MFYRAKEKVYNFLVKQKRSYPTEK